MTEIIVKSAVTLLFIGLGVNLIYLAYLACLVSPWPVVVGVVFATVGAVMVIGSLIRYVWREL